MSLNIHILNASKAFDRFDLDIRGIIKDWFWVINGNDLIDDLDVLVQQAPRNTIPEIGLGGFAPDGYTIIVSVDFKHPDIEKKLDVELSKTLAHEFHHCLRWRGPGYGNTLFECMISEGLADHFQVEITGGSPPLWSSHFSQEELKNMEARAKDEYWNESYDHNAWFFGSQARNIPRWAGYSLGFWLVGEYLKKTGLKARDLCDTPAKIFFNDLYK